MPEIYDCPLNCVETLSLHEFTAEIYRDNDPDVLSDAVYVWLDLKRNRRTRSKFRFLQIHQVEALIVVLLAARRVMKPLQASVLEECEQAREWLAKEHAAERK